MTGNLRRSMLAQRSVDLRTAYGGVTMRNHLLAVIVVAVVVSIAIGASSASALVKPREFTLLEVEGPQAPSFGDPGDRPRRAGDRIRKFVKRPGVG